MPKTLIAAVALIGTLYWGGSAIVETIGWLCGSRTMSSPAMTALNWTLAGASWALAFRLHRHTATTSLGVGAGLATLIVLLVASETPNATGLYVFGAFLGVAAAFGGIDAGREYARLARLPNPLRDLVRECFDGANVLEVGSVQYFVVFGSDASPAGLRVQVFLQNCRDTEAVVRVRLEEDAVGEPGVALPEVTSVSLDAAGFAELDWTCPVVEGHRGEGWFHVSLTVQRDMSGTRTHPWKAATGPVGLKATQLLHAAVSRRSQYLGVSIPLPPAAGGPARVAEAATRSLSEAELTAKLRTNLDSVES